MNRLYLVRMPLVIFMCLVQSSVQVGVEDIAVRKFMAFEKKESLRVHLKSIADKALDAK